jgi:CubicO group peptidase (beta-lactamase class C family)
VTSVEGTVDARFQRVRDAFIANFDDGEIGAACAVIVDGRQVVDLWGGWADEARTRPWEADTLVNAYSVGKPIVALSLLQLVARGAVDLDVTADRYWPELVAGQQGATVRHALCHRAGVPAIRTPLTNDALWDWSTMAAAVGAVEPWWVPGTQHAYHASTYGHVVGELARRVHGLTPGEWLRAKVAEPFELDFGWGIDTDTQRRCADVVWQSAVDPPTDWDPASLPDEQAMIMLGYFNPPGYTSVGVVNTPAWRGAQVPSANLHATARAVAGLYAALIAGQVLDRDVLAEATKAQSEGWCPILEREATFGLGFQPTRPDRPFGPNAGSFGHYGSGGALGFADPSANLAFGYVMNAVKPRWQNSRNRALITAVYDCI